MVMILSGEEADALAHIIYDAQASWDEYGMRDPVTNAHVTDEYRRMMSDAINGFQHLIAVNKEYAAKEHTR